MLEDIIKTTSFQSYLLSLEGKCIILATYLDGKAYPVLWLIIAVFPEAQNISKCGKCCLVSYPNARRKHKGIPLAVRQGENNRPFQEFLAYQKIVTLTQTKNFECPSITIVRSMYKYFFVQLYILKLSLLCRSFDRDQTLLSLV